jgi:uncharacterized protein
VSGIWLHILTLIVGYGLLVQGYGIWKLRHALSWHKVMPFIIGGAIGVPIGGALLAYINLSLPKTRRAVGTCRAVQCNRSALP